MHTVLVINAQHQFRHLETFGRENGLGNNVFCMAEDGEGFFWVGTQEGLFRFDGTHARQLYYKLEENLGFGYIRDLAYDSLANQMWFCADRGIFRYDLYGTTIDRFNPEDFVPKS